MTVEPSEEPSLCCLEDHSSDEEAEEVTETAEADVIEADPNEIEDSEDDTDEQPLETAITEFLR